jgi:uncharacterized protein YndB with AHSA1/START domain
MSDKLVEEVHIAASPARVFRAWTNRALITDWWSNADFRTTHWAGDVRPGGYWQICFEDTVGNLFSAQGHYLRADHPNHLSFTWKPNWDEDPPTTIELSMRPTETGTVLHLVQHGFSSIAAYQRNKLGWSPTMSLLRSYLDSARGRQPTR